MKLFKILLTLSIFMISPAALAWEKVGPDTWSVYGTRIYQSAPTLTPFSELVYNSKQDTFGVSFLGADGKRTVLSYGIFRLRTCAMDTTGSIAGTVIRDPATDDQMDRIFIECKRPAYFRIWDTTNNYTLYKFENVGPIPED